MLITHPRGIRDARLWAGLTAIVMVISHREIDGVSNDEIRYDLGSAEGTAEDDLRWARGHWGIENALHWVLDVCFREDDPTTGQPLTTDQRGPEFPRTVNGTVDIGIGAFEAQTIAHLVVTGRSRRPAPPPGPASA